MPLKNCIPQRVVTENSVPTSHVMVQNALPANHPGNIPEFGGHSTVISRVFRRSGAVPVPGGARTERVWLRNAQLACAQALGITGTSPSPHC